MRKSRNDTFGKKPPAPSVKVRGGPTTLGQRSGAKPLEPLRSAGRPMRLKLVGVPSRFRCGVAGDSILLSRPPMRGEVFSRSLRHWWERCFPSRELDSCRSLAPPSPKISAFVVENGAPGLRIGKIIPMAGGRGAFHSEVFFENLAIPAENRLGKEGDGFAIAMQCLDAGRINWAAYCVGAAQHLLDLASAHARERYQFGRPLADNQGIQWMLADMAADLHGARLVCYQAAWRYDQEPQHRASAAAMAKLTASEMVCRVAGSALQLFGGAGYRKDEPIERIWREVRAIRILEGTSEIMRHIVARDMLRNSRHAETPISPN